MIEVDSLEATKRGEKGFGSTGIKSEDQINPADQSVVSAQDKKYVKQFKNEPTPHINVRSQASKTRQMIAARQIQKLAKQTQPVYLAIVRPTNDVPRTRRKEEEIKNLLSMRQQPME